MTDFTNLHDIEAFFATIPYKKKDFPPFEMLTKALKLLGNPQDNLQYIQVTGTNGKGSTSTYLSYFLHYSGLNVGLFTSPHLFMITERIKVNNHAIPVAAFITHFNRIYNIIGDTCKLIQFEWLYLIALDYFNSQNLDIVILEVGIGGKYDSTSTIPHKLAAVMTNIAHDHRTLLGNSLEAITEQKSAIITDQTKFAFIGNITDDNLLTMIDEQLTETQTPGYFLFHDFWFDIEQCSFSILGTNITIKNNTLPPYQYENIALALAVATKVLSHFNTHLNYETARRTIETLQMPIRFEVMTYNEQTYIFDGAHNIAGLNTMLEALAKHFPNNTYTFIYAAMADKEYQSMLDLLAHNGKVVLFDFHAIYHRAFTPLEDDTFPIIKSEDELKQFMQTERENIFIYAGSIYFVSYIRNLFNQNFLP